MQAAIYARKSTDQTGVADEAKSVTRQIDHATAYAGQKGWTVSDAHVYVDDGISGAEFANRPGFLRLMNSLKPRAPFQVLIMSEESRLGREAIETAYALKQLVQAGVRVFFYLEDRERTLDTPTDKIMMSLTAFADELEREKGRQRTYDAMLRKAKAGHVTGGRCFGYDNLRIDGHVEHVVHEAEAAIVRRIFDLAAAGNGLKAITKALNAEGVASPRPQQGRPHAWAPSSVREILHREQYRGRRIWNKTRKRDAWGQHHQTDRPEAEWLTVECEPWRIVSDTMWHAAHARIRARREAYDRWKRGEGGAPDGRGVRKRYFLTGFGRCERCGGSMQAVSRASGKGRTFRYCCATYWNRGASICPNGKMVAMPTADQAVQQLLRSEVLKPAVVEQALDQALALLSTDQETGGHRGRLEAQLARVERELKNLSETAAQRGGVPAVLEALTRRDTERQRLVAERAALDREGCVPAVRPEVARAQLTRLLDDWTALLTGNVAEARALLDLVLAGQRISFQAKGRGGYQLTVPVAFDRLLTAAIPDLSRLQCSVPRRW